MYRVAHATATGPRERNEDFCAFVEPGKTVATVKGMLAALADGVSGGAGGREAAEYTVRGLLADYYATPDTWAVPYALERVLSAINRWLIAQAVTRRDLAGMSCTLSALVLRGQHFYLAQVGDSRIYRLRGGVLEQLTTDHVWDRPDMRHVLKRAVGLDHHLMVDFSDGDLQAGDTFLLVSDGVWEPLGDTAMRRALDENDDPELAAAALVTQAHRSGGQDNASALVIRVDTVAENGWQDHLSAGRSLPVPPRLKSGIEIDGFEVLEVLHASRLSLLYKVKNLRDGQNYVLKTLSPDMMGQTELSIALMQEEWLAKRALAHYFPQVLPLVAGQRSALYYVMSWHAGATLQQHIDAGRHFSVADITQMGIRMLKGLASLHRLNILHRDIKPANLHWGDDGRLRILDFGVAASLAWQNTGVGVGTPAFMAPELLLEAAQASVSSELYAVGVTLYYLLTRHYPYGEIEPFQHPVFGEMTPVVRYRPETPVWLEHVLQKAVARKPGERFETAEEFLLALEYGERRPLSALPAMPLLARQPLIIWRSVAIFALVLDFFLAYILFVR